MNKPKCAFCRDSDLEVATYYHPSHAKKGRKVTYICYHCISEALELHEDNGINSK